VIFYPKELLKWVVANTRIDNFGSMVNLLARARSSDCFEIRNPQLAESIHRQQFARTNNKPSHIPSFRHCNSIAPRTKGVSMPPLISTPHLHSQGLFIVQVFENRLASNTRGMCTHSWSLSVSSNLMILLLGMCRVRVSIKISTASSSCLERISFRRNATTSRLCRSVVQTTPDAQGHRLELNMNLML